MKLDNYWYQRTSLHDTSMGVSYKYVAEFEKRPFGVSILTKPQKPLFGPEM